MGCFFTLYNLLLHKQIEILSDGLHNSENTWEIKNETECVSVYLCARVRVSCERQLSCSSTQETQLFSAERFVFYNVLFCSHSHAIHMKHTSNRQQNLMC